jgi:hypothetical protein
MKNVRTQQFSIGLILILVATITSTVSGQEYSSWGKLKGGTYQVGFRTIDTYDSSRIYKPDEGIKFRPLLIHLWYPTIASSQTNMNFKSYVVLETQRENITNNNVDEYCKQTIYGYIGFGKKIMGNLEVSIDEVLSNTTASLNNAKPVNGRFPLIIYAPSLGKSSIQNNIACEYLASHGYLVASVASAGENSQVMTSDEKGVMAQVQDMEYIVNYLNAVEHIEFSAIGTFGFSWGGFANIIHQMRNDYVKAVASWDGSIEYQGYEIAKSMEAFKPGKLNVPFIFFGSKNEDWTEFPFYKSVKNNSNKYLYRLKQLEHVEFTAYWTVFSNAKVNASSYNLASYRTLCEHTLFFSTFILKVKNQ